VEIQKQKVGERQMARFTSILFPQGGAPNDIDEAPGCFPDLHLDEIIAAVTAGHGDDHVDRFFYMPLRDVSTVEHRHQVFRDLECDQTRQPILNFVDGMRTMRRARHQTKHLRHLLQQQGWFIHAVQTYCETVALLGDNLAHVEPASRGLHAFADYVAEYTQSATFQNLVSETEAARTELDKVRYTVHIQGLRVHVEKYSGQTDYSEGALETFERFAAEVGKDYHVPLNDYAGMDHVEEQILGCVAKLYPNAFALLDEFCRRNQGFVEPTIARFDHEIRFYLYYLAFVERFTAAGLNFSYPEVTTEPGFLSADDAFDLALAIKPTDDKRSLVRNDFRLSGPERILVVTGPNQGGKTTLARAIGQCAYLTSLGCPIPAARTRFTLPDQIYTHFERQETLSTLHGRLEEELVRIHNILSRATAASLIIMNESFSSTTLNDALLIGTEIVDRIIKLGCSGVYVSFLDELAGVNQACVSMVGEVAPDDPAQRTFKFTRRPADGLAYAAALATKYGLNHDVLRRRISQ
jgi:DNA mismatch repair protein MutS